MHYGDLLLRFTTPVLLLVLIILLVRRKQHREFPVFFAYVTFSIVADSARQIASGHPADYFIVYWAAEAFYGILALLVLREVFHRVFVVEYDLHPWVRYLLPFTVVLILSFSIYQGIQHTTGYSKIRYIKEMIYWFDLGVHTFQGALLLLLLGLRVIFPVRWLRYEFGIIAGFGCNAVFTMSADLLHFDFGSSYEAFFRYGPPIGFILATLIWLQAFYRPPEEIKRTGHDPQEILDLMRRHASTAERIKEWLRHNRPFALPR